MVKAIRSFAARIEGKTYAVTAGDVLEMPAGADWVTAGLVLLLPGARTADGPETAVAPETAVVPAAKRRKAKAAVGDE